MKALQIARGIAQGRGRPEASDPLRFEFVSSYRGAHHYRVHGDGPSYRLAVRRFADAYEPATFNGDEAHWRNEVLSAIGQLRRSAADEPVSRRVVDAFNEWRAQEHRQFLEWLRARPDLRRQLGNDHPVLVPPAPVRGAYYKNGVGWVENDERSTHEVQLPSP